MSTISSRAEALKAAGLIGTWETDVQAGVSVLDREAAALLAGSATLAGQPLTLEAALARVHPDDRDWLFARIRRTRQTGGPIAVEFRILGAAGEIRRVLTRGILARDARGAMRGYGAYIDTTGFDRPPSIAEPDRYPDPLTEAESQVLRAREALGRSGNGPLLLAADLLLWEIGRALAARRLS
ncbi:PAS domain-containing protein [Methylobacterium sp. NEAU 140]|uniref:PAS domain-containing protein n=1 Tax=Methylobacterium sp. NEAU 140 TaxID=3064945 RepID=UPI0027348E3A|nr:PAS domain-containing protein [Methylobacterium sp. NEAU 140]MDP4023609.1 PAS domain-containing protein [Methylobacterium sp. NEAU 140]